MKLLIIDKNNYKTLAEAEADGAIHECEVELEDEADAMRSVGVLAKAVAVCLGGEVAVYIGSDFPELGE